MFRGKLAVSCLGLGDVIFEDLDSWLLCLDFRFWDPLSGRSPMIVQQEMARHKSLDIPNTPSEVWCLDGTFFLGGPNTEPQEVFGCLGNVVDFPHSWERVPGYTK